MITIQELKKKTGLTVRTLRHYHHIGLLIPAGFTPGGHRLYSEENLITLQQIEFFKTMGFKLQEIKEILQEREWDWRTQLNNQLSYIMQEQQKLKQTEASLRELLNSLSLEGGLSWPSIHELIRLSRQDKKAREKFRAQLFNEKEAHLLSRLPNMSYSDPDSLEWIALLGQIKQLRHHRPDSPHVQRIIRRMIQKANEDFKGEEDFINKLWDIRKSPTQSEKIGLYPVEPELLTLMEQAWEVYLENSNDENGGEQ